MQIGTTCKKISCYMRNSVCKWLVAENSTICQSYVKQSSAVFQSYVKQF